MRKGSRRCSPAKVPTRALLVMCGSRSGRLRARSISATASGRALVSAAYSPGLKERLGDFVAYQDLMLDLPRLRRWHPLNRSLYLGYKVLLAGLLMTQKGDRVAMANSVETRYPFLDEDVIAFASPIHRRWKLHGFAEDKYLLGQAAARILPPEIAQRRKAMFRAPLAESFLAHPPRFVRDLISPQSLARTSYFDAGAVRRDCEALAKGEGKLGTFAT